MKIINFGNIKTKPPSKEYKEGWDRIYNKRPFDLISFLKIPLNECIKSLQKKNK